MGGVFGTPIEQTLERQTIETGTLLNGMIDFMVKNADLLDLYALASPKQCQKYIILTADTLHKQFKLIDLNPSNPDSSVFIQRTDKLTQSLSDVRKERCYQVAQFFVRILHIFASISLTIIDMDIPKSNEELEDFKRKEPRRINLASWNVEKPLPFFSRPQERRPVWRGGAIQETGRDQPYYQRREGYTILNKYLTRNTTTDAYDLEATGIRVPKESLLNNNIPTFIYTARRPRSNNNNSRRNRSITISAKLEIAAASPTEITLRLSILTPSEYDSEVYEATFRREIQYGDFKYNNQTLPQYIKKKFDKILDPTKYGNSSYSSYNRYGNTRRNSKRALPEDTDTSIPEYFRIRGIVSAVDRKPRVKAYCVARAIQLLSPTAYLKSNPNPTSATTSICDPKFVLLGEGSLPKMDDNLSTSTGLRALNLLFFNMITKTTISRSNSIRDQHTQFLNDMYLTYEEIAKNTARPSEKSELSKLINKSPPICAKKSGVLTISDQSVISKIKGYATQLYDRQNGHVKPAMDILRKLFIINGTSPIRIQKSVEEGGLARVEEIATEARELLINYYTGCETTYRGGVEYIRQEMEKTPPTIA